MFASRDFDGSGSLVVLLTFGMRNGNERRNRRDGITLDVHRK
jgi:hypothetical protein